MRREDEPQEFAVAELYFGEIRSWLPYRESAQPWQISAGSQLAGDDELTAPYRVSNNIANALVSAIDHLHTLDSLLIGAGASHTLSPFTLIRGAIESAAQAAWIASPQEPQLRVTRSLSLSLKEAQDRANAYGEIASQRPQHAATLPDFKEDEAELNEILAKTGFSSKLKAPSSTQILKDVRELVPRTSVLSIWQLCSGFAHARQWASDAVLTPTTAVSLADGVTGKHNRPTMKITVWAMTAAMDLTRYSLDRYTELAQAQSTD
ncbi:hypothetical protein [Pseudarthrobacter sp. YAF2]|uniref:hypothetical protein n=1 Tax=Pseudarthrobacter sp. YAF2 TaxID=3233078 RepID=UPI003F9C30FE